MNRYGLPEIEGGALDDDDPQVSAFDRFNGATADHGLFGLNADGRRRWHERMRKTARLAIIDVRIAHDVSRLSKAIRDEDPEAEAKAIRALVRRLRRETR